jgi:hypothetical protein
MERAMHKVDERGKFFTDRVSKGKVEVLIATLHGTLRGHVHVLPGGRVKDLLNSEEQFLAVTDATIPADDPNAHHIGFIAVNKQHILSVIPVNEPRESKDSSPGDEYSPH